MKKFPITLIGSIFSRVTSESPNGPFGHEEKFISPDDPSYVETVEAWGRAAESAAWQIDIYSCDICGKIATSAMGGIFTHLTESHAGDPGS